MYSLLDIIKKVSDCPEMYLGRPSLERLEAFVDGYLTANEGLDDGCLCGFQMFVSKKFRMNTCHSWAQIIQFFSQDERQAFDTFVKLFEEFRVTQGGKQLADNPYIIWKGIAQEGENQKDFVCNSFRAEHLEPLKEYLKTCNIHDGVFRYARYDQLRKCFAVQIENPMWNHNLDVQFNGVRKFVCDSDYKWGENETVDTLVVINGAEELSANICEANCEDNLCFQWQLHSGNCIYVVCTSVNISKAK